MLKHLELVILSTSANKSVCGLESTFFWNLLYLPYACEQIPGQPGCGYCGPSQVYCEHAQVSQRYVDSLSNSSMFFFFHFQGLPVELLSTYSSFIDFNQVQNLQLAELWFFPIFFAKFLLLHKNMTFSPSRPNQISPLQQHSCWFLYPATPC